MAELHFYTAQKTDCEALTQLMRRAKAHWGYDADLLRSWEAELTIDLQHLDTHRVMCAATQEGIVGFCSLSYVDVRCKMENLFVEPRAIGQGYGRALFAHALQEARDAGTVELWLEADPHARSFYEHMGMRVVGLVPGSAAGRHLPLMIMPLFSAV